MTGDTLSSPTSVEEVNGKSHSKTSGNGHLLVLGFGSQAHVVNSFKVGMYLAERGVTITYVSRQKYINQLKQSYSPEKLKALGIRTVGLADGYEGTHIFDRATRFEQVFQPYLEELIADRKAGLAIPTAILADRFLQFAKVRISKSTFQSVCAALQLESFPLCLFSSNAHLLFRWHKSESEICPGCRPEAGNQKVRLLQRFCLRADDVHGRARAPQKRDGKKTREWGICRPRECSECSRVRLDATAGLALGFMG